MGEPKQKTEYLALYQEWLRRGKPGRAPDPVRYGLTTGEVSTELPDLEFKLRPAGMSSWGYYEPEYYQPLQAIRRIADLLGIDPDEAAAEWHEWSQRQWNNPEKLKQLLSDYLHAEHTAQEDFSEYLFKNSRGHRSGHRYSRIPNPHPKTSASTLIAKRAGK